MKTSGIGIFVIGGVLVLSGCGGGDDGSDPQPSNTAGASGSGNEGGTGVSGGSGGSSDGGSSSDGGTPSGGGTAGSGGGGGSSGSGGNAGSGGLPEPVFESNPSGAELELTVVDGEPDLVILNSNITQPPGSILVQWFAEVRNDGDTTACYVQAMAEFYDAADVLVWKNDLTAYADTPPYVAPAPDDAFTIPCLAPGKVAPLYSNDIVDEDLNLPSIKKIKIALESIEVEGITLHPDPPTISNLIMTESLPGSGSFWIEGDVTANTDMDLMSINVYGRNASTGFYDIWKGLSNPELLPSGDTYHLETTITADHVYDDLEIFVDWDKP